MVPQVHIKVNEKIVTCQFLIIFTYIYLSFCFCVDVHIHIYLYISFCSEYFIQMYQM